MKLAFIAVGLLSLVFLLVIVGFWFWNKVESVGKKSKPVTLKDGSKLRRMGLLSEIWHLMYLSKQAPTIHCAIYGFDPAKKNRIEFWEEVCRQQPNFRSIPLKHNGSWYWKELEFSKTEIKKHIKEIEIDLSKFEEKCDEKNDSPLKRANHHVQQIAAFMEKDKLNRQFEKDRPHWDVTYVTLKGHENLVFAYLRCHHAIGDGAILMKSIFENYEKLWPSEDNQLFRHAQKIIENGRRADLDVDLEMEATRKQNRANVLTTVATKSSSNKGKESSSKNSWKDIPDILKDYYSLLYKESPIPLKSVFRKGDMKREYELSVSNSMNMGTLKILCHNFSCTVNDLMMSLWLNSLSKYLHKNADKSEVTKWKQLYGNDIVVRFITIFNLRKADSVGVDDVEENDIAMIPVKLPLGEMSFENRLKLVKKALGDVKNSQSVGLSAWLIRAFYAWGGAEYVIKMLEKASTKCVALFSNIKGPVFPLAVGTEGLMWRLCCATNPSFSPLSCSISSFAGNVNFSLATDVGTMTSKQSQEILDSIPVEANHIFENLPDEDYRWF